jgi:hypothetical protein
MSKQAVNPVNPVLLVIPLEQTVPPPTRDVATGPDGPGASVVVPGKKGK